MGDGSCRESLVMVRIQVIGLDRGAFVFERFDELQRYQREIF